MPRTATTRAPDVRLSRCASHAGVSLILRPDPAALRVTQTSDERGMSSCRTPGTLRHMAWLDCHYSIRSSYPIRITTLVPLTVVHARQLERALLRPTSNRGASGFHIVRDARVSSRACCNGSCCDRRKEGIRLLSSALFVPRWQPCATQRMNSH